jgi:tetratricopeptide (TPR) repeat protein
VTRRLSGLGSTAVVVVMAVAMFAAGAFLIRSGPGQPASIPSAPAPDVSASTTIAAADLDSAVSALQSRLERVPADHTAWAALGTTYVQQAAVTGDPSYYPKAQAALRRSLSIEPQDNAGALTGLASLSAARHDFAQAVAQAKRAQRINRFSADNLGILSDALIQLGRYDRAFAVLQRMVDLQPGVPSLTRVSYAWELRGQLRPARIALERALDMASRPSDIAFCRFYLGELAWNAGRVWAADEHYAAGLQQDPSYLPLLSGRAKVAAARGDVALAIARYDELVQRMPTPSHLIAYADLLRSVGRAKQADQQDAVVGATQTLLEAEGVNVDPEIAVFDADRGRARAALTAARGVWRQQRSIEAADAYSWALHANGRHRTALTFALRAARLGTQSALLSYHRGMIERALGRDAAARRSLRDALQLNPDFSPLHAPRAEAALRKLTGG